MILPSDITVVPTVTRGIMLVHGGRTAERVSPGQVDLFESCPIQTWPGVDIAPWPTLDQLLEAADSHVCEPEEE